MNEQWRKELQQKMDAYRESAPEVSWSEIEQAVKANRPKQRASTVPMWSKRISAAAAVALIITGIGVIRFAGDNDKQSPLATTAKKTGTNSETTIEPTTATNNIVAYSQQTKVEKTANATYATTDKTNEQPATTAATTKEATVSTEETSGTSKASEPATTTEKSVVVKKKSLDDMYQTSQPANKPYRMTSSKFTAKAYMSNTTSGYNNSGQTNVMLASAELIGEYINPYTGEGNGVVLRQPTNTITNVHHRQPIRFGLSIRYNINDRWSVESGLTYSYLYSDITGENGNRANMTEQKLNYVGIPVNVGYSLWRNKSFNIYVSGGGTVEKMVSGKADIRTVAYNNVESAKSEDVKIKPLQFSVNGSVGAEYQILNNFGVYIEPGLSYYFNNSSEVPTIYKDKQFNFNLNLGLRFNIK